MCMIYARLGPEPVKLGEWNLGRAGLPVNIFALTYTIYVMIWLPFPATLPVTGVNMNYAGPIFIAVFIFAISLWFLRARKHWPGPNEKIVRLVVGQE